MNKKAIQLSMNFLVIIILSIVIVGFSFYIFFFVLGEAQELGELTQAELNERVEGLQCEGTVCVSPTYKKLNRGKFYFFGVKILNTFGGGDFYVNITALDYPTLHYAPREPYKVSIGMNEEKRVGIGVTVPNNASSGIYIFNVDVEGPAGPYGNRQQIKVEVP